AAGLEIGAGPGDRLRAVEGDGGGDDALEDLSRALAAGAGRQAAAHLAAVADLAGVPGGSVGIGGRDVEQLEALAMLEGVVEPAEGVQILIAVLRDREVERVVGLEQDLSAADLEHVEDLAWALTGEQQPAQRLLDAGLLAVQHDVEEGVGLLLGE